MDLDPSALWDFAGEIVGTIRQRPQVQRATVTRIDQEGTVWVQTPGGTEAPASECSADVRPGDEVTLGFEGAHMTITGNATSPPASGKTVRSIVAPAQQAADAAKRVADAIGQHFWHDDNGAHVSSEAGDPEGAQNALWNSLGMLFRAGTANLLAIVTGEDPGVDVYDGGGNDAENIIASFHGSGARVGKTTDSHVEIDADSLDFWVNGRTTSPVFTMLANVEDAPQPGSYYHNTALIDGGDSISIYYDDPDSEYVDYSKATGIAIQRAYDESTGEYTSTFMHLTTVTDSIDSGIAIQNFGSTGSSISLDANEIRLNGYDRVVATAPDGIECVIANPREDDRYGTAQRSTALSLANDTGTAMCYHDFEPGAYLVCGHGYFATSATGARAVALTTTSGSLPNTAAALHERVQAASGGTTHVTVAGVYCPTVAQRLYLNALQASGGALNAQAQMRWVRLL